MNVFKKLRYKLGIALLASVVIFGGNVAEPQAAPKPEPVVSQADLEFAKLVLEAQEKGVVGELIRFDVSKSTAESFKWLLVPPSEDFQSYDDGQRAVFSARKPGEYMFIVACAYKGSVDVVKHVVVIEGSVVDPSVIPDVVRPDGTATLDEWITYWCAQSQRPKDETLRLAASFESVAATIVAGVNTTPEEIIKATAEANRSALGDSIEAWIVVLQNLQADLKKRAEAGSLNTPEQHAVVWREIAKGLRKYASLFPA